jgi:hypothetical protein
MLSCIGFLVYVYLMKSFICIERAQVSLSKELAQYIINAGNRMMISSQHLVILSTVSAELIFPFWHTNTTGDA